MKLKTIISLTWLIGLSVNCCLCHDDISDSNHDYDVSHVDGENNKNDNNNATVDAKNEEEDKFVISVCTVGASAIRTIDDLQRFAVGLSKQPKPSSSIFSNLIGIRYMATCLEQNDLIQEFAQLVDDQRADVCHPKYVKSLIEFKQKQKHKQGQFSASLIKPFYKRYMYAVALKCYRNLYINLADADRKLSEQKIADEFESHVARFEHVHPNVTYDFGQEFMDEVHNFIKTVSLRDQLEMLTKKRRFLLRVMVPKKYQNNGAPNNLHNVWHTVELCQQYSRYYENALMSIGRLSRAGFAWKLDQIESIDVADGELRKPEQMSEQSKQLLQKWLSIAQRCDALISSCIMYSIDYRRTNVKIFDSKKHNNMAIATLPVESIAQFENNQQHSVELELVNTPVILHRAYSGSEKLLHKWFKKVPRRFSNALQRLASTKKLGKVGKGLVALIRAHTKKYVTGGNRMVGCVSYVTIRLVIHAVLLSVLLTPITNHTPEFQLDVQ